MDLQQLLPKDLTKKYVFYDHNHAGLVFMTYHIEEYNELCSTLRDYEVTIDDLTTLGGSESSLPKKFSNLMMSNNGWADEVTLKSIINVQVTKRKENVTHIIDEFEKEHGTHKLDFFKNRIGIDYEWNSKDQTFDRDLYAFRTFHELGIIDLGIIVTRDYKMQDFLVNSSLTYKSADGSSKLLKHKYGASTTWMGKLLPRLEAGRSGGCPILVVGMTPHIIMDLKKDEEEK